MAIFLPFDRFSRLSGITTLRASFDFPNKKYFLEQGNRIASVACFGMIDSIQLEELSHKGAVFFLDVVKASVRSPTVKYIKYTLWTQGSV